MNEENGTDPSTFRTYEQFRHVYLFWTPCKPTGLFQLHVDQNGGGVFFIGKLGDCNQKAERIPGR